MIIFTYKDYLKYKEMQKNTLNLCKELEEEEKRNGTFIMNQWKTCSYLKKLTL